MSKVDWSLAPEGATHYNRNNRMFYVLDGDHYRFYCKDGKLSYGGLIGEYLEMEERPQPKPWSGPEDGLPPVNSVCEFVSSDTSWGKVKIIAHDEGKVVFKPSGDSYYGVTPDHKAVFRPFIDTAQLRETAIRELMDIAQVDCRVTAARLVDAGFKREAV